MPSYKNYPNRSGNRQDIIFKTIQTAEAQGWIEDLICAALSENPDNPALKAIDLKAETAPKESAAFFPQNHNTKPLSVRAQTD